ncbi:MAG: HAD-IA family hydrolase [bacterium]
MSTKVKAIFFDAGETLIHRNPSLLKITEKYLKKNKIKFNPKKLEQAMIKVAAQMSTIVKKGKMTDSDKWELYMRNVFKEMKISKELLLQEIKKRLQKGTSFRRYTDVIPVVKYLKAKGITTGVISNAPSHLWDMLKRAGILNLFEHIIISEETGYEKPHRQIFEAALKKAKVKSSEFVYVGDNYLADIVGARQMGMIPVWIVRKTAHAHFSYRHAHKGERVRTISGLKGLLEMLKKEKLI